jgi:hypothetical protein
VEHCFPAVLPPYRRNADWDGSWKPYSGGYKTPLTIAAFINNKQQSH